MKNYYHKIDSKLLEFDLDSIELKFGLWITKKEFGQRLNTRDPLPVGQFYMSVRVVAHDINITDKIARRLIHQFTKLNIIKLVYSSKNPKKGSIYEYLVYAEENQLESADSVDGNNESEIENDEKVDNSNKKQDKKTNSKTEDNNENVLFMDLRFIDDVIDKVKLSNEQYEKLKLKYGQDLLNQQIIALDNYIANGKGGKYKDHYRVLNIWCKNSSQKVEVIKKNPMNYVVNPINFTINPEEYINKIKGEL